LLENAFSSLNENTIKIIQGALYKNKKSVFGGTLPFENAKIFV
jgi:hypothetical protein